VDADTTNWHQLADLYGSLDVQLVRRVLENIKNDLIVIRSLRRGCQAQCEGWLKI